MARDLSIKTTQVTPKIVHIRVLGSLDAHTFERMEAEINRQMQSGIFKFIVDLEKVDYISSAGAGVFIWAISTSKENGGNIALLRPSNCVKDVFELLGLSQIFKFYESLEKAIGDFS